MAGLAFGGLVMLVGLSIAWKAFQARRPSDMPATSIWIDAPAVPFGFYHGWWLGCWVDSDQQSNRCRLYGPSLKQPVVYEGRYIPCEGETPVPSSELQLRAPSSMIWTLDSKKEMAPPAWLQNGKILVPLGAKADCEKIRAQLSEH
jgi:hypothetical protein